MDPISITAGAIGIAGPARSSLVELRKLIAKLTEAQEEIQHIASSIDSI
jgi:hypothetical protein